jgi:hypothetical protein
MPSNSVEDRLLLARLSTLRADAPKDLRASSPASFEWLGKVKAIAKRTDFYAGLEFERAMSLTHSISDSSREEGWGKIIVSISSLLEDLELRVALPVEADKRDQAFGPGAVYDFFKALNGVIASASKDLLIVDPYMDDQIFDRYLQSAKSGVAVRLLARDFAPNVKAAASTFKQQHGVKIDVRKGSKIHDRVLFVDSSECWVLGQSIKDAAANKPTYLAPLSPDVAKLKLSDYEDIWNRST